MPITEPRSTPPQLRASSLALDVGQTTTKARLLHAGHPPERFELPGVQTHRPLLPQLRDIIRAAADSAGLAEAVAGPSRGAATVALGVSGLTAADADAARLLELLDGSASTDECIGTLRLAHDSVTGYLGALGAVRGVVVAAGTGVVTLGVGAEEVARVDGWGHLMGDAGSACWMGRAALQAVMRAYDGRGPATALTEVVRSRWPDLEGAYIQLQNDPAAVSVMASFAPAVAEFSENDQVARRISAEAAGELAHSALTALRRVGEDGAGAAPQVAAIGGVLRSSVVREEFRRLVRKAVPEAGFPAEAGEGVDGAVTLLALAEEHPLHRLVSTHSAGGQRLGGLFSMPQ
ncbi:N-acetylglucosamine kinase [Nesterenkonia xinjiangensis]|uniref:N-acetylglucosamine kinase-like BadF-type ATPase n=1 Tax=Nesterenkonia xinjiangensis TaxID=225327 RepID=A0A7Z0GJI5_9MICC|nr:N-acetylglucosamine kinase-like BadF-type ATPase [Nesterenkonia xinjiangensis]